MINSLLVNLSFLINKPTGISTYATNLFPYLQPLNPTLLISNLRGSATLISPLIGSGATSLRGDFDFNYYPVPANLTPEYGTKGHLRRILWTQFQLGRIYHKLESRLLFSPIPEAPLFSKCRYIVNVNDLIPLRFPNPRSPLTTYYRYYIPQVLAQAEHILCISNATAEDITKFYHVSPNKISSIYLAHDSNNFQFLNLPISNYFLYIGRHDPYKNLHRMIAAFAALSNRHEFEFWIAGPADPRYTPTLKAEVEELGITAQVKFLDYVPYNELPILINKAIALVFPSLWEGFGLPVLEAMACGTPVITSNLSSLPEVTGDAAILVNPYNTAEITDAMQAITTDASWRSQLSNAGLTRAKSFSWEKTGAATAAVLARYL